MRVVLVGHGGREAALAWKIAQSPLLDRLIVTGDNPSWPEGVVRADGADVLALAQAERADLVVVGPEAPLAEGLGDRLLAAGVHCFGPTRAGARLETSKAFAKEILTRAGVPTAAALKVRRDDPTQVLAAERRCALGQVVVKVDGLAAGKGVFVCPDPESARLALDQAWSGRFGAAADQLLLEDLLVGPEVSVFALSDGERVVPLPAAQDHKRLGDGDVGPNTGGMGAYAPCPLLDDAQVHEIVQRVHLPVIQTLAQTGIPYRGVLFAGLMLTQQGPHVLEFNVRFGDPECQPLMCLWDDDLLPWLYGAATGSLPHGRPRFRDAAACCVVLASAGYPRSATRGVLVPEPPPSPHVQVFHAGAERDAAGVLRTSGGRVLGVTGVGADLALARERAYDAVEGWRFEGAQLRRDIGAAVLDGG